MMLGMLLVQFDFLNVLCLLLVRLILARNLPVSRPSEGVVLMFVLGAPLGSIPPGTPELFYVYT